MKKLIVISDIHIDDYRSDVPGQRLKNYIKLAEIIRDKAIELNSEYIILAGDILNRAIAPPHVLSVLYRFVKILGESKAKILYICGQHDINEKELSNISNTYLNVFKSENNTFYAHEHSILVEGTTIYFENYTRSLEVEPARQCDVYISHVTLGRVKVNNKKFKLGIFGDIHDWVDIDNMHSIGTPIQIHRMEKPEGVIGILTVDKGKDPKFERFVYDPEFKIFPKLKAPDKAIESKDDFSEEDKKLISILNCEHDFYNDINQVVTELGVLDIHNKIDMSCVPEPISLDFKLVRAYARDFKSIKDVNLEFEKLGKVSFISGDNGSGKTSIIEMVFAALLGDRRLVDKYQAQRPDADIMVGVVLEYKSSTYEICRGSGWTKFFVNGTEITKGSKTNLENYIVECLPFLNLMWMFYIKTYQHFFDNNRIEMVKKCFNLEIFDVFYSQGKIVLSKANAALSKENDKNNMLKGSYETERTNLTAIVEDLKSVENTDVTQEVKLKNSLSSLRDSLTQRAKVKGKLETIKSQIEDLSKETSNKLPSREILNIYKARLDRLNEISSEIRSTKRFIENTNNLLKSIKTVICPNCKTEITIGDSTKETLTKNLDDYNKALEGYLAEFSKLSNLPNPYNSLELQRMLDKLGKDEVLASRLTKLKSELEIHYSSLRDLDDQLSVMPLESDLQEKLISIEKKKILLNTKLNCESRMQGIINEAKFCKNKRDELHVEIQKCVKYISIFDLKNLDSLPYKVLVKISEFLSTNDIIFKTYSELNNGNLVLDISCKLKVGNEFIEYDKCSQGQKTSLDFFILSRFLELLGNVGIVGIDEGLSALNPSRYDDACEIIRNLNSRLILITSHQLGFAEYDSFISCKLDEAGETHIEVMK